jgi:hypothetical protein
VWFDGNLMIVCVQITYLIANGAILARIEQGVHDLLRRNSEDEASAPEKHPEVV